MPVRQNPTFVLTKVELMVRVAFIHPSFQPVLLIDRYLALRVVEALIHLFHFW